MPALVALLLALLPRAQDSVAVGSFAIRGQLVTEGASRPASGVTVLLFKADGTTVGQTLTDDTGKFQFRGLTKGSYEVSVALDGQPPMRERVAMNTQNQIYDVHFYLRGAAGADPAGGTVQLAYLRLPAAARADFDRALARSRGGKHRESVDALRKVLARVPDFAPAHNQLGIELYSLGNRAEAGAAFRAAIEADPRSAHAHANLGKLLNEAGEHLQAIEALKNAVVLDSASALGFFQLGIAYYQLGSLQVSESYLKRAIQLDAERRYPVRLELANLYLKRGEPALASEQIRAFIAENPGAPQLEAARRTLEKLAAAARKP